MKRATCLHRDDNIANVLEEVKKGDAVTCVSKVSSVTLEALDDVPFGFKIAVTAIPQGGDILKYGEVIGIAAMDIKPGNCVHVHNVEGKRGRGDLEGGAQ